MTHLVDAEDFIYFSNFYIIELKVNDVFLLKLNQFQISFSHHIELLSRFRLWTVCARIIKQCGNPFAGADNQIYLRERLRSINHHYVFRPIVMKQPGNNKVTFSDITIFVNVNNQVC